LIKVKAKKLTAESFSKFGKVVEIPRTLDETKTVNYWGTLATFKVEGQSEVGVCIVKKNSNRMDSMERHVKTPEVLVPIEGDFVLPVALSKDLEDPDERPSAENVEAFYVNDKQCLVMAEGVWHWAPFPAWEQASFFVIFKKETSKSDMAISKFKEGKEIIVTW